MSSPAVQLSFTLRTSPNVKTVHLLGSWDNYKSQLPLSVVKDRDVKPGSWKGTFRFQGSSTLKLGSRYWYYYIVDGYHVSHDPAKDFTTEPTTGRKLNILNVPAGKTSTAAAPASRTATHTTSSRHSREIPTGRALSPGRIQHPKPSKPYASQTLREADYSVSPIDDVSSRFESTRISDIDYKRYNSSPSSVSSSSSGSTTFSDDRSSVSSLSSISSSSCSCERFGITRSGQRVKLDCGGSRCGHSGSESDCSSEDSEDSDSETDVRKTRAPVASSRSAAAPKPAVQRPSAVGRYASRR